MMCKIEEEELSHHLFNISRRTSKVKAAFTRIVRDLKRDIEENSNLEVVINLLKASNRSLADCVSIGEVFVNILDHVFFFDFEIIRPLIHIGSESIQRKFKKYVIMFKQYSKHCVVEFECPSDAFGKSGKVYVLKLDTVLESLTAEELKRLCNEIRAILKHDKLVLRLLQVTEGCIQLTFMGLQEEDYFITEEQQQALRNVGVLIITYGDQMVDISHYVKIVNSERSFGK